MSSSLPRKPGRLLALVLILLVLVLAVIIGLFIRTPAPFPAVQATLASATVTPTSASTPQPPGRLRPTLTVMPDMRGGRLTRTPGSVRHFANPRRPAAYRDARCHRRPGLPGDERNGG